jgi:hypothetical protein
MNELLQERSKALRTDTEGCRQLIVLHPLSWPSLSAPLRSPTPVIASRAAAQNANRDEPLDILSAKIAIDAYCPHWPRLLQAPAVGPKGRSPTLAQTVEAPDCLEMSSTIHGAELQGVRR